MYTKTLTLVILCVLPGCIWSRVSRPAQPFWCQLEVVGGEKLPQLEACCTEEFDCEVFIKPYSTDYGIKNDLHTPLRLCSCNRAFNDCLNARVSILEGIIASVNLAPQSCLIKVPCDFGEPCDTKLEIVNYGNLRSEQEEKNQ